MCGVVQRAQNKSHEFVKQNLICGRRWGRRGRTRYARNFPKQCNLINVKLRWPLMIFSGASPPANQPTDACKTSPQRRAILDVRIVTLCELTATIRLRLRVFKQHQRSRNLVHKECLLFFTVINMWQCDIINLQTIETKTKFSLK